MYSAELLDHFEHPRHSGDLPDASVTVRTENPACGDIMQLAVKIEGGTITAARFRTRGCVAAIACGSVLTELIHGKTIAEAQAIERRQIVETVGGLPRESLHASHLAMDALAAALLKLNL
jgi:nitrogen fixation NifU-like protein